LRAVAGRVGVLLPVGGLRRLRFGHARRRWSPSVVGCGRYCVQEVAVSGAARPDVSRETGARTSSSQRSWPRLD